METTMMTGRWEPIATRGRSLAFRGHWVLGGVLCARWRDRAGRVLIRTPDGWWYRYIPAAGTA
jgi:hypothetical protein